jgi:hypothetical protein
MVEIKIQNQVNEVISIEYKSIFEPRVARYLLKCGNSIFDIKPNKDNVDRTIFIFKVTEKFKKDLASVERH